MKGITEIELTNVKTGEKETYVEENLVTNAVADLLKGVPAYYQPDEITSNFLPLWQKAMGGVVMFDTTLEENADNYFPPYTANKVGYAGADASNLTDPKRGSRNVLESEVLENGVKLVWDFTTAQANGTIQSICLTSSKGGEGEYGSEVGLPISYERFVTDNLGGNYESAALEVPYRPVSVEYDKVNKTYQMISLYQDTAAILLRKHNFPTGDISQTTGSLVFYENSEEENISIEYANPKNLSAGYLTFTDGHDGYWYGFYAPGNKSGNGSLYGIKISKEDYSVTDLGTQTLSSCLLVQVRRIYHTPVISNGYVYIPKYDTASSGSYYAYASSTLYKVNLTNFADITEISTGDAFPTYTDCDGISLCRLADGSILYGDRWVRPDDSCVTISALAGDLGWYIDNFNADHPVFLFRTFMVAGIKESGDTLGCIAVNPYYLATINNLSSPVTKTADKTMKITYTLTYE